MDIPQNWKTAIISSVVVLNVVLNSTVIAVIVKYQQLRDNPTHLFMVSLFGADLVLGLTALPISATLCSISSIAKGEDSYLVAIPFAGLRLCFFASLFSLCFVTVSKMVSITRPLHCDRIFTKTRCYVIVASIWLTGAVLVILWSQASMHWSSDMCISRPSQGTNLSEITRVIYTASFFGALVAITYATVKIVQVIFRTHLDMTSQVHSIGGNTATTATDVSLTLMSIRSGRNVLIICAVTVILTISLIIYGVGLSIYGGTGLWPSFGFMAIWIAICNTFVNSLLYLFLFRSVRTKAASMFRELFDMLHIRCTPQS